MLPPKFQVNWPLVSAKEEKNRFSRWQPSWITDHNDFNYFFSTRHPDASYQVFALQDTLMLPTFLFRRRSESDFQDSSHSSHLGFLIETILTIFIYKSPRCFLPSFKSIGLLVQEKKQKIDFQDGHHRGNPGFPIGMVLAIFDLQVTPMLPTDFQVNWPIYSGEEAKNGFSNGLQIGMISAIFDLQIIPMLPTKFQVSWPFGSGEEAKK